MASTAYCADQQQNPQKVAYFPSKVKKNNQYEQNHDHYDHDDNNNNHARACARTRGTVHEMNMQTIRNAYHDVFGRPIPKFVEREILAMIDELQISYSLIECVIEYTACAPRPSWAYARAVLYRSHAQGIISEIDFRRGLESRGRDESPNYMVW